MLKIRRDAAKTETIENDQARSQGGISGAIAPPLKIYFASPNNFSWTSFFQTFIQHTHEQYVPTEVEFSRTSFASKPQVVENCPVLGSRTTLFFELLKFCRSPEEFFWRSFLRRSPEKNFWRPFFLLFFFFFLRPLAPVSLILDLGLEHSCPWPREGLSSEGLSLALASDFFVSLALASSLVSSTPPLLIYVTLPAPPKKKLVCPPNDFS